MAGLFKNRFQNKDEEIASKSNAGRKGYTNEDILRALGINEKLITNEETNKALIQMLEYVENFDLEQIQNQEQFDEALEACRKEIEVSKEGKNVLGVTNKNKNDWILEEMKLGDNDELTRSITSIRIERDKKDNFTNRYVFNKEGKFRNEDNDFKLESIMYRAKTKKEPGIYNRDITKDMIKDDHYNTKQWDYEEKGYSQENYDTNLIMIEDNVKHPYPVNRAQEFRSSLKKDYEEYTDEKNKLNPEIITDQNILKRNILEELGVNEQILSKPGLLVELEQMVDYAAGGKSIQTSEDVEKTLENLRETTQITENQVSGIKANRTYSSKKGWATDLTEGVKITDLKNNEYEVENTKYARSFTDKEGLVDTKQESIKTIYRENSVDRSILEKTKRDRKSHRETQNIEANIEGLYDIEQTGGINKVQYKYLADNVPTKYSHLQTMLENEQYVEIWKDTRSKDQQIKEDQIKANRANEDKRSSR